MLAAILVTSLLAAPADEAWEAFRAGEQGRAEAIPALRKMLRSPDQRVSRAALDSLVRLQAEVPWNELQPLWTRHRAPVLILLARHPEKHGATLVSLLDDMRQLQWQAACNVLAPRKTAGLALHLLKTLELRLDLVVVTPGTLAGVGLGGGSIAGRACGRMVVPEGWPPVARYDLTTREARGAVPFARGASTVFYVRKVYGPGTHGIGTRTEHSDRNPLRLAYLEQLLGRDTGLKLATRASIDFTDGDTYVRDALKARDDLARDFDKLAAALLKPAKAEPLKARIKIQVHDLRHQKKPALPTLP